ncbi:hypothetical protein Bbelb_021980 [Branchiostoma belcheri]|nr:hypothetical protein Bbelb_021980 [Branchiostoma belcheri]
MPPVRHVGRENHWAPHTTHVHHGSRAIGINKPGNLRATHSHPPPASYLVTATVGRGEGVLELVVSTLMALTFLKPAMAVWSDKCQIIIYYTITQTDAHPKHLTLTKVIIRQVDEDDS